MAGFIELSSHNLSTEHLCCIIRSRKPHPGVEAKRRWLAARIPEGHVFRKLDEKGCCFIEYAPLETAWTPIAGDNYMYIYCLWVSGEFKGKGYGAQLMEHCLADAWAKGRSGVCMLGSKKQKNWLSDQSFAKKYGFQAVDGTESGYELLALSFDGSLPHFPEAVKRERIDDPRLTIYYDMQCPFIYQKISEIRQYCEENGVSAALAEVISREQAKALPCVFNNWAAFIGGKLQTVNLLDVPTVQKLLKKSGQ